MIPDTKWKSRVQENLLSLYLRLNGYFITGFIMHSAKRGQNLTEIDLLAVRFPYNTEPERQVGTDISLETSNDAIDLAICEVKSRGQQLQFNRTLLASPDRIAGVLRWAGVYQEQEIVELAPQVLKALSTDNQFSAEIPCIVGPRQTRIRGLLCCPELNSRRNNQPRFLTGATILGFISRCLCPTEQRSTCATRYDFSLWGPYEDIVRYIKSTDPEDFGTINDLYAYLDKQMRLTQ